MIQTAVILGLETQSFLPQINTLSELETKQINTGSHAPVKTYYGLFFILELKIWDMEQLLQRKRRLWDLFVVCNSKETTLLISHKDFQVNNYSFI